jgi:hypothetical protein
MKITEAKADGPFRVALHFDDGTSGTVDLAYLAGRGVFSAWLQDGVFEQLSVSPDGALQWPGDLDLCPDSLYLLMTGKTVGEVFPAVRPSLANA